MSKQKIHKDLTVADMAELVGVKPRTVNRWLRDGILKGYKLPDRSWRIRWDWYLKFTETLVPR